MSKNLITATQLMDEIKLFRQSQQSLMLASCTSENDPLASYAPFVEDDSGCFYLLLSDIAAHSVNLRSHQTQNKQLSILLIEDEKKSRNIFARKRLSYNCMVSLYSRDDPVWQDIIDKLYDKFGKTIELLAGLSDFNLYCLNPCQGNYVRGFGQAYELKDAKVPVLT